MKLENKTSQFTKIQELVYELKVTEVMTRKLISVHPTTKMSELRTILRDNRISGTPVTEGKRLIGLVSVEDLITWLTQGGADCPVEQIMSQKVQTLYADEPLVHAVSKLEEFGYGRLPVLDRENNTLVGLITKGDIIEGLLHELQIDYHEEEIHRYRASHFFEDMIADKVTINFHYHIQGKKIEQGGEVASDLKRSLKRLGIHPDVVRRAAIATYEAEMNVIIYAEEGRVDVNVEPDVIRIEVRDRGEGIADVVQAVEPGYSTAPDWVRELGFGAGMGLPNIRNCARDFDLTSTLGRGTTLKIGIPTGAEDKQCA
ncbi:MAG: CBS domain-containing protein [Spirochaetaceae bacterium]|nr:MAG: CBS domain-containing protein [Spirochaetaceae bacterium]